MARGDDINNPGLQSKKKRTEDDSQPPADGQKPIQLQRRRVWRACESCRRKKIKCDGTEPTCSQCQSSGSQCTWLQTKDRAALSRHYVQELESRLLHMESIFTQLAPALEQMGVSPNGMGMNALGSTSETPGSITPQAAKALRNIAPKKRAPSEASSSSIKQEEDDVSDIFGQLALDEYGHTRWIGGSSTMSLIQSFRQLTSSPLHRISPMDEDPTAPGPSVNKLYFPAAVFFGKVRALPGPEEVEYPERDLADKLVDAYFSRFHFLMPVIDKPSFVQQYTFLMDNKQDINLHRQQTAFIALVFAVFAVAASIVEDPRLSTSNRLDEGGMGMVYYERALILQYISHASIQPSHVQCFCLLASYLCSVNCLPQAWILVGQAVRSGQDLGLHRSPRRLALTPVEKETRRKMWWGVYTLDRMLAVALGRPLGINDADCDVELPICVDDERLPDYYNGGPGQQDSTSLMHGFVLLIKLYEIAGRVLRQVYALENCRDYLEPEAKAVLQQQVEALDVELTDWVNSLPSVFKTQSETNEQASTGAILCSHYYSILTTLHRNLVPVKGDQSGASPMSTEKAVSSARSCIRLAPAMKHGVPPSHHLAFFIQHLFSSAVILLLYAMHCQDPRGAQAAMQEASGTLGLIESWEGQWPGARKCKELLADLTQKATEAIAKGPVVPPPVPKISTPENSPGHERKRSITIASPSAAATASLQTKAIKNRSRRTHSRDPVTATRRMAAISPYRSDGRARSSSRKRPANEDQEPTSPISPFYQNFPSPTLGAANSASNHSSPGSANIPSPIMTVNEPSMTESSPNPTHGRSYSYGSPSMSNVPMPASPQYDYNGYGHDYGQSQQWGGAGSSLDMFQDFGGYPPLDTSSLGLGGGLSQSPPGTNFAAPGLPFQGLDFIKNFNSNGGEAAGSSHASGGFFSNDQQPSLWQSYDPGAFAYNPDMPFSLGEMDILNNGSHQDEQQPQHH